jgi:DNA-binding transcriptional ArsR family regulator
MGARTATELATVAEVSASTASAHLSRLVSTHLLVCLAQGRHRYYRLAGADVAGLLENMMAMAGKSHCADHPDPGESAYGANLLRSSCR